MASPPEKQLIKAGSMLSVEVEHALDDVLMVCLRNGDKVFRGILLDSDKGACPVGIPNKDVLSDNLNSKFGVPVQDTATVEPIALTPDPQSALSYRQSYFQDMPLPPPRPFFCSKPQKTLRSPDSKTVSNSRSSRVKLRPRNVLCSKCKAECASKKPPLKRKLVNTDDAVPKKKPLIAKDTNTEFKTIKISFATPQGKNQVTISPKQQTGGNGKKSATSQKVISQKTVGGSNKTVADIKQKVKKAKTVLNSKNLDAKKKTAAVHLNGIHSQKPKKKKNCENQKTKTGISENKKAKITTLQSNGKIRIIKSKGVYMSAPSKENTHVVKKPLKQSNTAKVVKSSSSKVKPQKKLNDTKTQPKSVQEKPKPKPTVFSSKLQVSQNLKDVAKVKPNLEKSEVSVAIRSLVLIPPAEKRPVDSCSESSFTSSISSRGSTGVPKNGLTNGKRGGKHNGLLNSELSDSELEVDFNFNKSSKEYKEQKNFFKKNVTQTFLADGRKMCLGDIVWGKIPGSPWWPGRISRIAISRDGDGSLLSQDATVRWFAATTVSHVPLHELSAFLPSFNKRFNKKRRGAYKAAISQAIAESKAISSEVRELNTMFETSQIC